VEIPVMFLVHFCATAFCALERCILKMHLHMKIPLNSIVVRVTCLGLFLSQMENRCGSSRKMHLDEVASSRRFLLHFAMLLRCDFVASGVLHSSYATFSRNQAPYMDRCWISQAWRRRTAEENSCADPQNRSSQCTAHIHCITVGETPNRAWLG